MRGGWLIGLAVVLAFALAGSRVAAQEPKEHHSPEAPALEKGSEAEHGEKHIAPGPDRIFERALDLTIWTIVVFVILLFVLGKYAWGPMMKGLEAREHAIHSAVEEAHKAREETSRIRDEVQRERQKAAEEARATIEQARRDAQKQGDELRAKALAEIQAERDRMRHDMELARDAALQDLWSAAARLATLVASKAVGKQMNLDDHRKLVDEAIAELHQAGTDRKREMASV
jgi:F-type H+-transporting ATPase subunit b